jgi:hypothetical protein
MPHLDIAKRFDEIEIEHQKMESFAQPKKRAFEDDVFVNDTTLADILGPPQEYIFYQNILGKQLGIMPKGEPCMIAAPGGTGKSFLALACAIAAASGSKWLHYEAKKPIKTIFIGAEDNQNTLGNRFYRLLRGLDINKDIEIFESMKKNLALWGKKGERLPIIDEKGRATQTFEDLKYRIEQEGDVGLLVLDPARSFMARDTETDNGAASEWKDLICALTELPSRPTVLVTHHTNKSAIRGIGKDSAPSFDQSSVRGASALVDGFRWILNMQKLYQDGARKIFMKIGKSNFSDDGDVTEWRLNYEDGGIFEQIENSSVLSVNAPLMLPPPRIETYSKEQNLNHSPRRSHMDSIEI